MAAPVLVASGDTRAKLHENLEHHGAHANPHQHARACPLCPRCGGLRACVLTLVCWIVCGCHAHSCVLDRVRLPCSLLCVGSCAAATVRLPAWFVSIAARSL